MSRRTERLASVIRQELAMVILHELNDPRLTGMPSITRVEVADDMSVADVYVTVMGTPGQQSAALNALRHSAGLMRTRLTKALTIRQTPYLQFHMDEKLKKELALLETLERVARENAELDRQRAERGESAPGEAPHGQAPAGEAPPPGEGEAGSTGTPGDTEQ
jgi:ribosome-binding factor A